MTEAKSRSWKREGAKDDLRIDDFWVEVGVEVEVEDGGGAETFEVAPAVVFLLILAESTKEEEG